MKKKLLAITLAVTMALCAPMNISAAWQRDTAGNWQWSESGKLQTGWKQISGKWYHFNWKGIMNTGWLNDNGTWYYLDNSGAMKTGWLLDKGTWYYLNPNGAMATGWKYVNGQWYYLQSWGGMLTGWLNDNGNIYYLDSWGGMATNWRMVNGIWYYMNASGIRETGWAEVGGKYYFLDENGAMQTGIIEVNGKVYYLDVSGAAVTGKVKIDGKTYEFAETGESIGIRTPKPEKAFDESGKKMEVTVDGGISGSGSIGGGGSSSGGSSGGSGGSGDDGGGEVDPPEHKIRIDVDGGTWEDTEEGLHLTTNEGTYLSGEFSMMVIATSYAYIDSQRIGRFEVDDLFAVPEDMKGELGYLPEGLDHSSSSNYKEISLSSAAFEEETGVLTLVYADLDVRCTIRLKISEDKKGITLLGISSDSLIAHELKENEVSFQMDTLPDTAALVRTEQEMRDALADEGITKILIRGQNSENHSTVLEFDSQLVISRSVEISVESSVEWQPSKKWTDKDNALLSIQNGAVVRFTSDGGRSFHIGSSILDPSLIMSTIIEVKNATLEMDGAKFYISSYGPSIEQRMLYLENATARFYNCQWRGNINCTIAIELDTTEGSKSELEIIGIGNEIKDVKKQIISGSPDSTVILPDDFIEFTNDEGQREWTNDPDKLPQPPEETEEPNEPEAEEPASTDTEDLKPAEPISPVT